MKDSIDIKEYDYPLAEDRIAAYPLEERSNSKLLVYDKGSISHRHFYDLPDLLPENVLLVRNITKVVQARLLFTRKTSGIVEVFCLEPLQPHTEMSLAMQQKGWCVWMCMAKKLKRWKVGEKLYIPLPPRGKFEAELLNRDGKFCEVKFTWEPEELTWAQVLDLAGKVPLPPYIHRDAEEKDKDTYQTIYAKEEGAVAAPTAGLHFTPEIEKKLQAKGIELASVTLHVSAGTFQAVEEENALNHPMHREQIVFEKEFIEKLANTDKKIIAVGTTSLRALESLYWFGAKITSAQNASPSSSLSQGEGGQLAPPQPSPKGREKNSALEVLPSGEDLGGAEFFVSKMQPYETSPMPVASGDSLRKSKGELLTRNGSMNAILQWMEERDIQTLIGHTEIMIFPGYEFKIVSGLITNFHQPQSTLLLLVSALIGDDWKRVYNEALKNDYRFLSYGDSSLLLP